LLLVPTAAQDGAGKDVFVPPTKEDVAEKYMARQERLATWERALDTQMRLRIAGPCPAVLKNVKGELAAEVAEKLATKEVGIEAGKDFELSPGIQGRIEGIEPVGMYGRKGVKVKYSYVVPGKPAEILPVQVAAIRLFDAKGHAVGIDLQSSGKETVMGEGSKIEGGVVVATDAGKAVPTRIEFTIATGVTVTHLPVAIGDIDLHALKGLEMARGPVKLPAKVEPLGEAKGSEDFGVSISAAKVLIHQMNLAWGKRMGDASAELMFTVRPPAGIPAIKLVMLGFDAVSDATGKELPEAIRKLAEDQVLEGLARNKQHLPWELAAHEPMSLNLVTLPQALSQIKGTAVVVVATTVAHKDLPLEAGATAELVAGVSVKIAKVYPPSGKSGISVSYEYDLALTGEEAGGPCFPRGWIMAEWVDDAGQTQPVGWPKTGFGFGANEESKATNNGRHGKGTAAFIPPAGWKGKIVALRAYGGEGIGLKRVTFELKNVPLMGAPGMSPVE